MKGLQGLIIALVLGGLGIGLNMYYLNTQAEVQDEVALIIIDPNLKHPIRIGDRIKESHLSTLRLPGDKKGVQMLKAVAYLNESQLDSAQIEIDRNLTEHRMTKSSGRLMTDISLRTGQYDDALRLVTTMAEKYPTDFSVQMMCGRVYLLLASKSENQALMPQAYRYIDRGVKVNRFKAGYATQLVQETMQRMQQQQAPGQSP